MRRLMLLGAGLFLVASGKTIAADPSEVIDRAVRATAGVRLRSTIAAVVRPTIASPPPSAGSSQGGFVDAGGCLGLGGASSRKLKAFRRSAMSRKGLEAMAKFGCGNFEKRSFT